MSTMIQHINITASQRVEIKMCRFTKLATAAMQVCRRGQWHDTGLTGVGHGRQDALADLDLALADITAAIHNAARQLNGAPA